MQDDSGQLNVEKKNILQKEIIVQYTQPTQNKKKNNEMKAF